VRDLQKEVNREGRAEIRRLKVSSSMPSIATHPDAVTASDLAKPGGFRRNFLIAEADRLELSDGKVILRPTSWSKPLPLPIKKSMKKKQSVLDMSMALIRPFVSFVDASDDEDDGSVIFEDDEQHNTLLIPPGGEEADGASASGLSSVSVTILTWFKSFVGSAVLLMPKGFCNAGMLGATIAILASGVLSTMCMFALIEVRHLLAEYGDYPPGKPPRTYGDLGMMAAGKPGKILVQVALIFSQVGFACVNMTFVGDQFTDATGIGHDTLVLAVCFALMIPLMWVRYLKYFALTNFIAILLQFITVITILVMSLVKLFNDGIADEVNWGVSKDFLIFYGTSVYTFEGIAMVLPMENEMREPHRIGYVTLLCMTVIVVFITLTGIIGYAAFGNDVDEFVIKSLPQACNGSSFCKSFVTALQISYCLAVLAGFPLIMVPPIKITEKWLFGKERRSGKKWWKNGWRFILLAGCLAISVATKAQLGNFVSVIGAVCCVPLAFVFPAWFRRNSDILAHASNPDHKTRTRWDNSVMWYGGFAGVVSLVGALASWSGNPIPFPVIHIWD